MGNGCQKNHAIMETIVTYRFEVHNFNLRNINNFELPKYKKTSSKKIELL